MTVVFVDELECEVTNDPEEVGEEGSKLSPGLIPLIPSLGTDVPDRVRKYWIFARRRVD